MPLDPDIQAYFDKRAQAGLQPFTRLSVEEARHQDDEQAIEMFGPTDPLVEIQDRTISGPNGPIPIRVYVPNVAERPLPVAVNFLGGGR